MPALPGERESQGSNRSARLRYPLVVTVGKPALEIGLEGEGARNHVPRAILLLRAEDVRRPQELRRSPLDGVCTYLKTTRVLVPPRQICLMVV